MVAAVLTLGAAVIHFAYAPAHIDERASHGAFFLAVGWLQLVAAIGLGFGARPRRVWLAGTAALHGAVITVWLVSRTVGVPGDEAEAVTGADAVTTGLEVTALLAIAAVAFGWADRLLAGPMAIAGQSAPSEATGPTALAGPTEGITATEATTSTEPTALAGSAGASGATGPTEATGASRARSVEHGAADDGAGARSAGGLGSSAVGAGARRSRMLVGVPSLAVVALVSAAVTPALAGDHSHGGHDEAGGGHGGHGGSGHDVAHMTGAASGDDWNRQRVAALEGYLPAGEVERLEETHAAYLTEQIRLNSPSLRELPEAEREERIATYVDWTLDNLFATANGAEGSGGGESMHSHGPSEWQPITDPDEQRELQDQLAAAATVIERFPTADAAMAAGYQQTTPYVPGIGAHYFNFDLLEDGFDPDRPEMLLFNGNQPTSRLVGLSYATVGEEPPDGFAGPNDVWHQHPALCVVGAFAVGLDHTPEELCASIGGEKDVDFGADLHMAHLWQVPGWESPWGLFSAENPMLNLATADPVVVR